MSEEKLDEKIELKLADQEQASTAPSSAAERAPGPESEFQHDSKLQNEFVPSSKEMNAPVVTASSKSSKAEKSKQPPSLPYGKFGFLFIMLFLAMLLGQAVNTARLGVLAAITEKTQPKEIVQIKVAYADSIRKWKGAEAALPAAKEAVENCTHVYGANDARTAYAKLFYAKQLLDSDNGFGFVAYRAKEASKIWHEALSRLEKNPELAPNDTTDLLCKTASVYFLRAEYGSYNGNGITVPEKEDFRSASLLYLAALQRWHISAGCDSQTNTWANLAECLANLEDYDGAARYMKSALEKMLHNGDTEYSVYRYEKICNYLRMANHLDESLKYGELGLAMAKRCLSPGNHFYGEAESQLELTKQEIRNKKSESIAPSSAKR